MAKSALFVKDRENASTLLDQFDARLVVEVLDVLPRDLLPLVLFLLALEGEFDEDLLQLLVDKVDADLLKVVVLEDLKAVDVEHSDVELCRVVLHAVIQSVHEPVKHSTVE